MSYNITSILDAIRTDASTYYSDRVPSKSDRSHVVLWAKELSVIVVFLRPLGLRLETDPYEKLFNDKGDLI